MKGRKDEKRKRRKGKGGNGRGEDWNKVHLLWQKVAENRHFDEIWKFGSSCTHSPLPISAKFGVHDYAYMLYLLFLAKCILDYYMPLPVGAK